MSLEAFTFQDPAAFLIPVEALGEGGLEPAFAERLREERGVSPGWLAQFDAAWSLARQRLLALVQRDPRRWFPPRRTNLVVCAPGAAHPYHRPLFESASLLYQDDFEPERSSVELGAFLLVQLERLHLTEEPLGALLANLSYWLLTDEVQAADFAAGAARSPRPDAAGYQALAAALPWVRQLHHNPLRPPTLALPLEELAGSGLLVTPREQEQVQALLDAFAAAARAALGDYSARFAADAEPGASAALLAWLEQTAPRVLVVDPQGQTLWDPDAPAQLETLRAALGALSPACARSLQDDLAAIDAVTRRFLAAVQDPGTLPHPTEEIDQADGVYLHQERGLVAYALEQPVWSPLREPAPPYLRLALAARAAHEWGHLCEEAGLIRVAPGREQEHEDARARVVESVHELVRQAAAPLQAVIQREMQTHADPDPGAFLLRFVLERMPDYLANRVARHLLAPAELEAYVRVNVRPHLGEILPPVRLLGGLAIEYQYLELSVVQDRLDYFLGICPAADQLLRSGFVQAERLQALLDAVGALCATYAIDPQAFSPGSEPEGQADPDRE